MLHGVRKPVSLPPNIRETGNGKQRESFWDENGGGGGSTSDLRQIGVDVNIPLLVIGTKQDLVSGSALPTHQIRRSFIADEYLTEEIHLNCNDERCLAAGSTSANKLSRY